MHVHVIKLSVTFLDEQLLLLQLGIVNVSGWLSRLRFQFLVDPTRTGIWLGLELGQNFDEKWFETYLLNEVFFSVWKQPISEETKEPVWDLTLSTR